MGWSGRWGAAAAGVVALSAAAGAVRADEPLFGYVYTTDLLPKGQQEVEQWATWRGQKLAGAFNQVDGREEYEYGLTDRLQLAIYGNWTWAEAYQNGPFGETTPPEPLVFDKPGFNDHYDAARFVGVTGEVIYRVLSPYTDPIGLALYEAPTGGPDFFENETKLILQKDFRDDRLVLALNLTYLPEWRYLSNTADSSDTAGKPQRISAESLGVVSFASMPNPPVRSSWQEETDVNIGFGATYRFAPNWSAGAELENEHEYASFSFGREINNAYYIGPTVHYGGRKFFVTATYLQQMPWARVHRATDLDTVVNGLDYDRDFELRRVRLKVGYLF